MRLIVDAGSRLCCPPSCARRAWRSACTACARARNWGCGDFRDLRGPDRLGRAASWAPASSRSIRCTPSTTGGRSTPARTCRIRVFYQNFLYLDVEAIEDFQNSRRAQRLWRDPAVQAEVGGAARLRIRGIRARLRAQAALPEAGVRRRFCAGQAAARGRVPTLSASGKANCSSASPPTARSTSICTRAIPMSGSGRTGRRRIAIRNRRTWRSSGKNTGGAFCFISTCSGRSICSWPRRRSTRGAAACRSGCITTWRWPPIASARTCGRTATFFVAGCRVGSPPDDFAPKGQDWAFPPPNSEHHCETGYRLFAESIRKNCRHGGALRIDHVMRFFRLYWIPDGVDATDGAYVRDR